MILETLVGKIEAVQHPADDRLLSVGSESRDTVVSVINGVELVGGAVGEDRVFDLDEDIIHVNRFGKFFYSVTLSRTEFMRYLDYEVLNFLSYKGINEMRRLRRG